MGSGWFHSQKAKTTSTTAARMAKVDDHGRAKPVLLLALVEGEFETADAKGDKAKAHEVDLVVLGPLFAELERGRIFDHAVAEVEGQQANRYVDEEDPVPVEVVRDPTAEGGADGWRDDDGHAVEGECLAAFFHGKGIGEDGLFAGGETAASGSLKDAGDDEKWKAGREAAKETSR